MSLAPTKTPHPSLAEIREHDGTSESIRAAFYRLDDARRDAGQEVERIDRERPALLLSSSIKEIDAADEKSRRLKIFVEQLGILEPQLRDAFKEAKISEEDADYNAQVAELGSRIEAWNADIRAQYAAILKPLLLLLERERELRAESGKVKAMPSHKRRGAPDPDRQLQSAYMRRGEKPVSLEAAVCLPSLTPGAPMWGN